MYRFICTFILAGAFALSLTSVNTTAAQAENVQSLRGDKDLNELNATPEVYSVRERAKLSRNYRQQPPLIPHRVDKYQINLKVNQCLRCHDWPYNTEENAPKVSETHYINREGIALDRVARTRWFCTQCHVPQSDAMPLVENTFKPVQLSR